jgi:peptidyl-prolyl cis-trans isomerase-like protein 2
MVKRQKEKQYQSARENRTNQQLRAGNSNSSSSTTSSGCNHPNSTTGNGETNRILPFSHCALSLVPYETPICNSMGIIFDQNALMKFILQYKKDPVTGVTVTNLTQDENYIRLVMDQNDEGMWQCPILTKPFHDRSKVVAIIQHEEENESSSSSTTTTTTTWRKANVYSYESYYELNVKTKNYVDLISGRTFHPPRDVIIIYDPHDMEFNRRRNNISSFHHIIQASSSSSPHSDAIGADNNNMSTTTNVRYSVTATRVMETLRKKQIQDLLKEEEQKQQQLQNMDKKRKIDEVSGSSSTDSNMGNNTIYYCRRTGKPLAVLASDVTGIQHTIGRGGASSSFTSTATSVSDTNRLREATTEEIITAQCHVLKSSTFKNKKGYVKLHTNYGTLTIELHCDIVPRTCMNFLGLCRHDKYNDTIFHRLIPKFMIQGGGSSSKSSSRSNGSIPKSNELQREEHNGDSSIWGTPFIDEFDSRLRHNGVGIVSMANHGPNTNQQQFFITFQSCDHLDNKHSVFGVVVDGINILKEWEQIPVKKNDCPTSEIKILRTEILEDPTMLAYEYEQKRIEQIIHQRESKQSHDKNFHAARKSTTTLPSSGEPPKVGQYLRPPPKSSSSSSLMSPQKQNTAMATTNVNKKNDDDDDDDDVNIVPFITNHPPKPTTKFGNFSGW